MPSFVPRRRGIAPIQPGLLYGPASQADYELVWIIEGAFRWRYSGGEHVVDPRSLLLIRPGMTNIFVSHAPQPTRYGYVRFRAVREQEQGQATLPNDEDWPMVRHLHDGDPIRPLLHYVLRLRDDRPDERDAAVRALRLALELFVQGCRLEPNRELPPPLLAVMQHVRRVWSSGHLRAVPLAELVDAAAISRGHLCRLFRAEFGVGPAAALELVRLSHAATLLTRSGLTLDDVAKSSGFADAYHLSHRFRPRYGLPPGQYRIDPAAPNPLAPIYATGLEILAEQLI